MGTRESASSRAAKSFNSQQKAVVRRGECEDKRFIGEKNPGTLRK